MKFTDIKVYKIAETKADKTEIRKWLDDMGASEMSLDESGAITDPELIVGLAGKRCYKSFVANLNPNVKKIRKEWKEYFKNILASGHGSVLEHANFTFAFEGVTRVFTSEMNRHRAGVAISEQSLRYVRLNEIPFWLPTTIDPETTTLDAEKARQTKEIIKNTIESIEKNYNELVKLWDFDNMTDFHQKKIITSLIRRILPLGVSTGAVYTMNGRAIRHICTMRCDPAAEEEIMYAMSTVCKKMIESHPYLYQDFQKSPEGFWYPIYKKV